ncbi:MFS transporter [Lacticaseibacillus pabuli]|uniref:MFS transporter n=1 Tax=Lacticaseibacillus pabuli TaxID=3025672 RepID=A0ABY7WTK5_9LACO|nr:MFS transporter [Lacticaseibacillus sp. KACC 23028]WDF82311.1 MFS transporter [Lacticaseibacillus sp. KACC 23028]
MGQVASAKSQSTATQRKWVLASTSAGFALENMDVMFLSFALSSIAVDMHLNGTQAGFISTITNLGMLVGGLIFGILGDRFGRVKTFSQTVFIFAFATAAMFFAHNIYMIYLFRFIAGIGAGGEYGVGITLIADNFPRKEIGRLTSIAAIGGQVGAVLAAIVAAWILSFTTWNTLFLVGVIPVILIVFIRKHVRESDSFLARKAAGTVPKAAVGELFKTPKLAVQTVSLIFMVIVQIAGYFGLMSWLPTIMQGQLHLSVSGSSVWMITTIIGMSLGMMTFGTILDKFGPRRAFGIFLLASALSVFGIAMVNSRGTMLLAGAVVGFFSNGMFGGYGAVISQLYPSAIRSTANNVIVNIGRAIGGFSSVVIGFLMDHYSLIVVMGFLATLYVLSCLTMLSIGGLRNLHGQAKEELNHELNN